MAPTDVWLYTLCPETSVDAKQWVQEALREMRYTPSGHLYQQMRERQVTMDDVKNIIKRPTSVEPYPMQSQNGGSCWRVFGRDLDRERLLAVGIDAYMSEDGKAAILCTVIEL